MPSLAQKTCVPCRGGVPPLAGPALEALQNELNAEWKIIKGHQLERTFEFSNFRQALDFTNRVGEIAEVENHHPDIYLGWGKVCITLWTHKIDGLTESDFILAAKIDTLGSA